MTSPPVVFLAWAAVVLTAGWRHRPAPARIRSLGPPPVGPGGDVPVAAHEAALSRMLERSGQALLHRLGRAPAPGEGRRVATALLVAAVALPVLPPLALPAGAVAWALPALGARRRHRRHLAAVAADLPDVVDLLVLA
ncbi:MAG TPA: hypothetical protein VHT97_11180, partial [Acidimicrobiales bacterium]|nr:hypothetical protein [Acidimicrobiales bacterium]